ncbi:hypothetical protein WICMUC_003338 [Wickerhamomyces mucosus]|uniref:Uncharacterized protein n=1 Tax=Wickerhamomyces mucosus TaxID=1378264 RepID=A0A9P8PN12_9ASCO|nr:hypothetical protein WICMUC_003338 [Wickerhamomyces mucosus]
MDQVKDKGRSVLTYPSGSPIIPIEPTFQSSNISMQHQLLPPKIVDTSSSSSSSRRPTSNPIIQKSSYRTLNHNPDYIPKMKSSSVIKLLLIGDAGVGKSALIVSYCDDFFEEKNTKTTVGVDLKVKVVNVDGGFFKTVIWDTAGQERYRNVIPSLYKGTNGVLLTYDVSDRNSFKGLYHWIQECNDNCDLSRTIFYIVGNKIDQQDKKVTKEDIKKFINHVKKSYPSLKINAVFEVSAKYANLVYGLFDTIIKDLVENRCYTDEQRLKNKKSIDLSTASDDRQRNCCSY